MVGGCSKRLVYPQAHKGEVTNVYHGVEVADPYRWLEDPDSPETREWIEAQNKLTFGYLEQIPTRPKITTRLTKLWNYEKYSTPVKRGGRYFHYKNDGLQNQYVLYTAESLDSEPKVLIDPNKLSEDGTVSLGGVSVSKDGKLMAYGLSTAGSDWQEWHVRNIDSGRDFPDHLKWIKFSKASWTKDGKGFFYSRYDEPEEGAELQGVNRSQKVFHHRLGTSQPEDTLVYQRPDQEEWGFYASVTDDGNYLIISVTHGTERKNGVFYKDLTAEAAPVVELLNKFDAEYDFIDNDGPLFWFRTDLDAPRGRVIAIDTRRPQPTNWQEVIPQGKDTLRGVNLLNDRFVAAYLHDAHSQVKIFDLNGNLVREVHLPGLGSVGGFAGKRTDTETFYSFTSFSTPRVIYRYDMETGKSTLYRRPKVDFDPDAYETKQVFYHSKDGTRVPMFITHKKGLKLDGNNPTYLYGYGGFNAAMTPFFYVGNLVWLEMGGVFAMPNIRGGGEYGKEWHEAGMKLNRQNVFDDFIAAAQWLIENKYTCSRKLAIGGASNGGLLVAACMAQRPELFGAVLSDVGVLDMLRFNKFTIGWAWESDYGSPQNPEEFKALYAYSPLHNLKPGTHYPAIMLSTADHDDRVVPAHSFKFTAALQAAQGGPASVLIRIETKAGHGAGKPTTKRIEEQADQWAFLVRNLSFPQKSP
ncbi:MAG: S9 family peptidase [Phycisphaerae bacterium]|nr:S9 family peptidase [Phycisphaerae bacterium]